MVFRKDATLFTPEKMLWVNVLWVAIKDVTIGDRGRVRTQEDRDLRKAHKDARKWFDSQSEEQGSFRWVCLMLDLGPDRVRRWVMEAMKNPTWRNKSRTWRARDER
ncbi:MAG: hypothetical protein HQL79_07610 [Magnetococcales bacterium]|nr:hypothetical protein [Magnetococcales bacterium]